MSKQAGADTLPAYSADPATCRDVESACREMLYGDVTDERQVQY